LFISIKPEKQNTKEESSYLLINEKIFFSNAKNIGGIVPNLIAFEMFIGEFDILL